MNLEDHVNHLDNILCRPITSVAKANCFLEYIKTVTPLTVDNIEENIDIVELHVGFTFALCKGMIHAMVNARIPNDPSSYQKVIMGVYSVSFTYLELFDYYRINRTLECAEFEEDILELTNKIQNFQMSVEEHFKDRPFSLRDNSYANLHLNAAKRARATLDII
jgi:ribosomal protein S15P/S13E